MLLYPALIGLKSPEGDFFTADKLDMAGNNPNQKDAVYLVIREVLGPKFKDGMNAKDYLGDKFESSPGLQRIYELIQRGLIAGSIPFSGKGDTTQYFASDYVKAPAEKKLQAYARRIMFYALSHDKRLNGGSQYKPKRKRSVSFRYQSLKSGNIQIRNLENQIRNLTEPNQIFATALELQQLKFSLFLKACNIEIEKIDKWAVEDLGLPVMEKKKAS